MLTWQGDLLLEPLPQPFLSLVIFEIESHKLFAWADFKTQSSRFLPPE
jgi:hypothetical protein